MHSYLRVPAAEDEGVLLLVDCAPSLDAVAQAIHEHVTTQVVQVVAGRGRQRAVFLTPNMIDARALLSSAMTAAALCTRDS
jgi:hypothetical protein